MDTSQQSNTNWFGRNWKWFVPVGCLGSLVILVAFVAAIFMFVDGIMRSSGAYKDAVAQARAHPAVVEALGSPIEEGWLVTGSVSTGGQSGEADIAIRISGPNGEATIHAVADKAAGTWTFSTLAVEVKETKERIDLLE